MAKEFKLTSKEIDEAYKKAAEITEGVDWNEDAITDSVQKIQFQGMDPAKIALIILKKGANGGSLKMDILRMIILGIEKGNNIHNI